MIKYETPAIQTLSQIGPDAFLANSTLCEILIESLRRNFTKKTDIQTAIDTYKWKTFEKPISGIKDLKNHIISIRNIITFKQCSIDGFDFIKDEIIDMIDTISKRIDAATIFPMPNNMKDIQKSIHMISKSTEDKHLLNWMKLFMIDLEIAFFAYELNIQMPNKLKKTGND